ncbi:f-box only protein [Anaeramoeba ignava]|uniref:F-box only protein n=1 Tax=Anaeramoeba ignava TaxID=1746090 RepID=A0A9Q0RJ20_ANAIG|nr:f-box only protein [Anaeramoeba ignava]
MNFVYYPISGFYKIEKLPKIKDKDKELPKDSEITLDDDSEMKEIDFEKESENENFSFNLPDEILMKIFKYLDFPYQLGICSCVNKQFHKISESNYLWKRMIKKHAIILDFHKLFFPYQYSINPSFDTRFGLVDYLLKKKEAKTTLFDFDQPSPYDFFTKQYYRENEESLDYYEVELVSRPLQSNHTDEEIRKVLKHPKNFFLSQRQKVYQAIQLQKKDNQMEKSKQKVSSASGVLFNPIIRLILYILAFPLTMYLTIFKADNKLDIPWIACFCPFFFVIFCFTLIAIPLTCYMTKVSRRYYEAYLFAFFLVFILLFVILLGLKLDKKPEMPLIVASIPMFLLAIFLIIFTILHHKHNSKSRDDYEIRTDFHFMVYLPIIFSTISISLLLISVYTDFEKSENFLYAGLIVLMVFDFLPMLLAIYRYPKYKRNSLDPPYFWSQILMLSLTFPSFLTELFIYLKLNNTISSKFVLISIPIQIPSIIIFIAMLADSMKELKYSC